MLMGVGGGEQILPQARPPRQIYPGQGAQEAGSMVDYLSVLVNQDPEPGPMSLWCLSSSQTSLTHMLYPGVFTRTHPPPHTLESVGTP